MTSEKKRRRFKKRNDRLRDEAWEAACDQRLDLALKLIQRALDQAPGNAGYWCDKGRIHILEGAARPAENAFRKALELSPDYSEAHEALARLAAGRGNHTEAVVEAQAALDREPQRDELREQLVVWREQLDAWREPVGPFGQPERELRPGVHPDLERSARYDWNAVGEELLGQGLAGLPGLVSREECRELVALDGEHDHFEHGVVLGHGSLIHYRFFARPLPALVGELRREIYHRCVPVADLLWSRLGREERFPALLEAFLEQCHAARQRRTTPIFLSYRRGAENPLHRDPATGVHFPFQLAVNLGPAGDEPGDGACFLVADTGPGRRWKRRELPLRVGDGVLFCTRGRPVQVGGAWGILPVAHGVSRLNAERRFALGIPFHDER